jgi:hypothetical protein
MRWLLASFCFLACTAPAGADESLPSRDLALPFAIVINREPESFDLIDLRAEQRAETTVRSDTTPHSIFVIKQHLGVAGGYDNGVAHGSVGYYVTVAEWDRWNFGLAAPEIGVGRYPVFDALARRTLPKDQVTVFISIASVHYRAGYLQSWGVHWYVNFEQVFDMRTNQAGSQVGLSFSSK